MIKYSAEMSRDRYFLSPGIGKFSGGEGEIIFINDSTDLFDSSTTSKLFADDIKIYSEISINCNLDMFQMSVMERRVDE